MMINEELYQLRSVMMIESMKEVGSSEELIERILKIDDSFKRALVKNSIDDLDKCFFTDEFLIFDKTNIKKAA
jgi:hypothetical protein